jgi:hypothetical protein
MLSRQFDGVRCENRRKQSPSKSPRPYRADVRESVVGRGIWTSRGVSKIEGESSSSAGEWREGWPSSQAIAGMIKLRNVLGAV